MIAFRRIALVILVLVVSAGTSSHESAGDDENFRVGVVTFFMETCTFCPRPTGIAEWEFYGPPRRGDEVLRIGSYIGGFVRRTNEIGGIDLVGIYSPRNPVGGSSGSWVTPEAFEKYTNGIVQDLRRAGHLDGVFLALHGAMAVTGVAKPEAEIVRRVRRAVGNVPIVVTLDLHANVDRELSDVADAIFITKHFPHYDTGYQGERAARMMWRILRGDYRPTMATRKPGLVTPSVLQWTGESPALNIMERARVWEFLEEDAFVSVAFGFAYADVPDVGATVMVVTNNDQEKANEIAEDLSDYIWRMRDRFFEKGVPKTEEGVREAIEAVRDGRRPVVIADHADRLGDATWILEELIRQDAGNFVIATLYDKDAIEEIREAGGVGQRVQLEVGGFTDHFSGDPVPIDGVVEYLGSWSRHDAVATVRFGQNNRVILTPTLQQITTPGIFRSLNIPLEELDIIVLKTRVHFRRGFYDTGLAGHVVLIDAPGWGPADLTELDYQNVPDHVYPIGRDWLDSAAVQR